jgi:hypothetical protein
MTQDILVGFVMQIKDTMGEDERRWDEMWDISKG